MSKRLITLIVLAGVIVAAVGAYLIVTHLPPKTAPASANDRVQVDQLDVDKIQKIVLTSDARTLTLEKQGGTWTVDGKAAADLELNTTKIEDIAYSFASLWAERLVEENPADLSIYGLDKPAQVATAWLADGTTRTYYLGAMTPTHNTYYLMPKDTPKVYAVWMNHGTNFSATLDSLRATAMVSLDTQNIQYVYLSRKGSRPLELYLAKPEDPQSVYVFGSWQMVKPYTQPRGIDSEKLQNLLQSIYFSDIKGFVEENARDLGKYGLEPPQGEIILKDQTNTLHLLVGKDLDEYTTYVRYPDSRTVYTIDRDRLKILDTKPFDVADKFAFITNVDGVDQVVVAERAGATHTVDIKREGKDENGNWKSTFSIDGKTIADDVFRKFYQKLIGVTVDGEAEHGGRGQPVVTFTFHLAPDETQKRGAVTVVMEYLDYNSDFYLVRRDGVAEFVTAKNRDVEAALGQIEELVK